jgi:Ni,Fe-hydrogenase I large subunit
VDGELVSKDVEKTLVLPYFNETDFEYLYSGKIEAYGNALNGILVVKKISDSQKRVALLSDFGNTLMDFKINNGEVEVKYVLEDLNKKIIVKKLKKYFQLLVNSNYDVEAIYKKDGNKIYTSELQSKRVKLFENSLGLIQQLKQVSRLKEKVEINYFSSSNIADSIHFKSNEIPFEMRYYLRE